MAECFKYIIIVIIIIIIIVCINIIIYKGSKLLVNLFCFIF